MTSQIILFHIKVSSVIDVYYFQLIEQNLYGTKIFWGFNSRSGKRFLLALGLFFFFFGSIILLLTEVAHTAPVTVALEEYLPSDWTDLPVKILPIHIFTFSAMICHCRESSDVRFLHHGQYPADGQISRNFQSPVYIRFGFHTFFLSFWSQIVHKQTSLLL